MATNSTYIYPVKPLKVTQGFGANPEYYKQYGQKGHNGLDLAASLNAPVRAARDGVVRFSGNGSELPYVGSIAGNYVLIGHGDVWTGYAHNSSNKVKVGQEVKQGDIIALAGRTGDASGVHVHFEFIAPANPVTNVNGYWGRLNPNNFAIEEEEMITLPVMELLARVLNGRTSLTTTEKAKVGKITVPEWIAILASYDTRKRALEKAKQPADFTNHLPKSYRASQTAYIKSLKDSVDAKISQIDKLTAEANAPATQLVPGLYEVK